MPRSDAIVMPDVLRVQLPLGPGEWIHVIARLAGSQRRPVGLELLPTSAPGLQETNLALDLTGMSFAEALPLLIQYDPRYVYREVDSVLEIQPARSVNNREDFLNIPVHQFILTNATIAEALTAVHQHLDPLYVEPKRTMHGLQQLETRMPARAREIRRGITKPISVNLTDTTVRRVLDHIARKHGEVWWRVECRSTVGDYRDSTIKFVGYDNWSVGASSRPAPPKKQALHLQ